MKRIIIVILALIAILVGFFLMNQFLPWFYYPTEVAVHGHGGKYDEAIYLYNLRLNKLSRLTPENVMALHPSWSPNSKELAYIYRIGDIETGIQIIKDLNDTTKVITPLTIGPTGSYDIWDWHSRLAWSPDGKQILFNAFSQQGEEALYMLNIEGGDVQRLSIPLDPTSRYFLNLAWSPSATPVIEVNMKLYLVDLEKQQLKYLADGVYPFWSPDGKELTYFCVSPRLILCGIKSDGTGKRIISQNTSKNVDTEGGISWSPDGRFLAYFETHGESGPAYLILLDLKTGLLHRVYKANWLAKIILDEVQISPK